MVSRIPALALKSDIDGYLHAGRSIDIARCRRYLWDAYEYLSKDPEPVTVSSHIVTVHSFSQSSVFTPATSELLTRIAEQNLHHVTSCDVFRLFHSAALMRDYISDDIMSLLVREISLPSRLSDLKGMNDIEIACVVTDSMLLMSVDAIELFQACADQIIIKSSELSAERILRILRAMDILRLRHGKLLDSIVSILPIVPCSDEELGSIIGYLVSMNAGTEEDRAYLTNLVRFRLASIVE